MKIWKILTLLLDQKSVNSYLINYVAGKENTKAVEQLNSEEFIIRAEDSSKDMETGTFTINLPSNASLHKTANITTILKICVGAQFLLIVNINVADKLINGFIGTIEYIHFNNSNKPFLGEMYVKFYKPTAGNSLKKSRSSGVLKECVPIKAIIKRLPHKKWENNCHG